MRRKAKNHFKMASLDQFHVSHRLRKYFFMSLIEAADVKWQILCDKSIVVASQFFLPQHVKLCYFYLTSFIF
jgi:hypothetical protein